MRVAVLGGGAVGSVLSLLISPGAEVVVYEADPARRDRLRSEGLILRGALDGTVEVELGEAGVPVEPFDLMLIAVPAQYTAEALRKVSPFVHRETRYISAQDGLVISELEGLVGAPRSASLTLWLSAGLSEDGSVEVEELREAALLVGEGFDPDAADTFTGTLSKYVKVRVLEGAEAQAELARRTAVSSVLNSLCAVANRCPALLREDEGARSMAERACREAVEALGIEGDDVDPFRDGVWDRLMPPMSIHLARHGKTEVEYLSGEILRKGREKGMRLPVQRSLYTIVKEMEAGRVPAGEKAFRELFRRVEEDEGLGLI